MTKKMRGRSGKKIAQKSRNSCRLNSRSCGCIGTIDSGPKCAHSCNQIQTLKLYLSCHICCAYHERVWPQLSHAGSRTDFRDQKSSDFCGELFSGEEFLPRTAFSGKKCRSIFSNKVISLLYGFRAVGCPLGREFSAKTCSLLGNEGTPPDFERFFLEKRP